MPWTTPRTWVTNELVTAAIMNTHVRDNLAMLSSLIAGPLSATPPAGPADGQLWAMPADATNGVVWTFRYNAGSASTYKWEFAGGPPRRAEVPTSETVAAAAANTWYTAPTNGPNLTLARTGEYWMRWGLGWYSGTASACAFGCGLSIAGANPGQPTINQYNFATSGQYLGAPSVGATITISAVNTVVTTLYSASVGGGNPQIFNRWLEVTPVRVI